MANRIHADKSSYTYLEFRSTLESLRLLAIDKHCEVSDLVRLATLEFVEREQRVRNRRRSGPKTIADTRALAR